MGLGRSIVNDFVQPYVAPYQQSGLKKIRPQIGGGLIGAGVGAAISGIGMANDAASGLSNMISGGGMHTALAGAGIGGVAGSLAVPALGMAGLGFSKALQHSDKIGSAALKIAKPIGIGVGAVALPIAYGTAKTVQSAGKGGINAANRYGRSISGLVKYTPETTSLDKEGNLKTTRAKWRPSKLGVVAAAGIAATMFGSNTVNEMYDSRAGTPSGARKATPNYLDNAGATGDLVFAMHQNRRG